MENLKIITSKFDTTNNINAFGNGHINDTYLLETSSKYILQKINKDIFKEPEKVMQNIALVTEHIKNKKISQGKYDFDSTLNVIKTHTGENYYKSEDGDYYRMYNFIKNANSNQRVLSKEVLYNSAKGFGEFFSLLSDFDISSLHETIPNFHHTPKRYQNLMSAIEEDLFKRVSEVQDEINFVTEREALTSVITNSIDNGEIPLRVTHNDTKLDNVVLDNDTNEALCVIDLDTVMPGSILYDFGDAIRFGASSSAEDEHDLDKVYCDMELFEGFTAGFLEKCKDFLNEKEKAYLYESCKILTIECGIRFLTDYLQGDVYFKTHYPKQNLYRAKTQFKLVFDMECKEDEMKKIIAKYL